MKNHPGGALGDFGRPLDVEVSKKLLANSTQGAQHTILAQNTQRLYENYENGCTRRAER